MLQQVYANELATNVGSPWTPSGNRSGCAMHVQLHLLMYWHFNCFPSLNVKREGQHTIHLTETLLPIFSVEVCRMASRCIDPAASG
jgi:hypothetical protein